MGDGFGPDTVAESVEGFDGGGFKELSGFLSGDWASTTPSASEANV